MNLSRAKKILSHASVSELNSIVVWAEERIHELNARARAADIDNWWRGLQPLNAGESLFVHARPMYNGHVWKRKNGIYVRPVRQRFDISRLALYVQNVQPRAQRVWLKVGGTDQYITLDAEDLLNSKVSKLPDPDMITEAILAHGEDTNHST